MFASAVAVLAISKAFFVQVFYQMRLSNDAEVHVKIFVVHTQPCGQESADGSTAQKYQWSCVSRGNAPSASIRSAQE